MHAQPEMAVEMTITFYTGADVEIAPARTTRGRGQQISGNSI